MEYNLTSVIIFPFMPENKVQRVGRVLDAHPVCPRYIQKNSAKEYERLHYTHKNIHDTSENKCQP